MLRGTGHRLNERETQFITVAAAMTKFLLLYTAANIIVNKLPAPIKLAFSFPQLITALAGGAVALVILKAVGKINSR